MTSSRETAAAPPYHHGDLRAALVEEALGLVREGGLAALSLREATRRAGVTPGAAYRHFRGRDELVAAAAREIQDRMAERMRTAAGPGEDGARNAVPSGSDDGQDGAGDRCSEQHGGPDSPSASEDPTSGDPAAGGPAGRDPTAGDSAGADPAGRDPAAHALARLRGVGLGYLAFARAEPGWFETVFFGGGFGRGAGTSPVAGEATPDESPVAPPFAELVAALDACRDAGVLPAERRAGAEFVCWSAVHGCAELMIHGPLRGADPTLLDALVARVVDDIIAGVRGPVPGDAGR